MPARSFLVAEARLRTRMVTEGSHLHPARWQGIDIAARPDAAMVELLNVGVEVDLRGIEALEHWHQEIRPNLPWADDHFAERVCGAPVNPGVEWANWPWAKSASDFIGQGLFNHNYMERYWPRQAGTVMEPTRTVAEWEDLAPATWRKVHYGIRGKYGDLNDVLELLRRDPLTRQAYLPIFFPEDTGVGDGGRKPCTLGYQFIVRDQRLHVYYPMRSCDLVRHFRDDCYLTVRLLLWVLDRLRESQVVRPRIVTQWADFDWGAVTPGTFTMHATSLHCFIGDYHLMRAEDEGALHTNIMRALS